VFISSVGWPRGFTDMHCNVAAVGSEQICTVKGKSAREICLVASEINWSH